MTRLYGPIDSTVTENNSDKRFISLNFFLLITFSLVFFVYNYIVKCTNDQKYNFPYFSKYDRVHTQPDTRFGPFGFYPSAKEQ